MFLSKIRDYQQTSQLLDTYTTALNVANGTTPTTAYGNITGNIPKVKVYGLEVDGVYAGIPRTTLRFAGAYNRAVYESFPNAAFPAEETNLAGKPDNYKDISGRTLPGAPKYTFNVGADYHQPVFGDKEVHTSVNLAATSGYISDTAMSAYSWISKNYTVDWSVGVGKLNKSFDVSLLVKNALGNDTPQSKTWTSVTPAVPRSVAVQFTGRL
jgi:outer membrane receptor protein involved in Fe transport